MRAKKTTRDDDVPGNELKLFGDGLSMTQLINNIYKTVAWPKDFTEVTIIALKKPKATKCCNHRAISRIAYTAKIVVRMLTRKIESKSHDVLGEDKFGFKEGGKLGWTRDAENNIRTNLEINEELCPCFIEWSKAFDREIDQINVDPEGNWYRLARKTIYQQTTWIRVLKYDWTEGRQEV